MEYLSYNELIKIAGCMIKSKCFKTWNACS